MYSVAWSPDGKRTAVNVWFPSEQKVWWFCPRRFGKCPRREKIKSSFLLVASKRVCLGCPISCSFMVLFRATVKGEFIDKNRSAPLSSSLPHLVSGEWEQRHDGACLGST